MEISGGEILSGQEIQEAILAEKRKYYRAYRARNKERIKENNRRYWARRAERAREQNAEIVEAK